MVRDRLETIDGKIDELRKGISDNAVEIAVMKALAPEVAVEKDQENKSVMQYILEIVKWGSLLCAIVFGSDGVEKFIK